eukprot:1319808-Karenia_brevis.AAC.1
MKLPENDYEAWAAIGKSLPFGMATIRPARIHNVIALLYHKPILNLHEIHQAVLNDTVSHPNTFPEPGEPVRK